LGWPGVGEGSFWVGLFERVVCGWVGLERGPLEWFLIRKGGRRKDSFGFVAVRCRPPFPNKPLPQPRPSARAAPAPPTLKLWLTVDTVWLGVRK
jgi:hypothetical protein